MENLLSTDARTEQKQSRDSYCARQKPAPHAINTWQHLMDTSSDSTSPLPRLVRSMRKAAAIRTYQSRSENGISAYAERSSRSTMGSPVR
jgi:hypothetical protein